MVQKLKRRLHKPHRQHSSSGLRRILYLFFIYPVFPPLHLGHQGTDLKEKTKCFEKSAWVCVPQWRQCLTCSSRDVHFSREAEARCLPLERFQMGVFQRSVLRCGRGENTLKALQRERILVSMEKKNRCELTEDVQASALLVISHCVLPDEAVRAGFQVMASVVVSGGVVLNWQPGGLY